MSKTCPCCGYNPIDMFTDRCPLCAEPVRDVYSDEARSRLGDSGGPAQWPLLVGGWIGIGLVLCHFFTGDLPWLVLSLGLCGAAWWAVVRGETLLIRLLGGSLLVLFVPGIWLASQPTVLPGLDRRDSTPERAVNEMMLVLMRGASPDSLRTCARLKTVSAAIYALHAAIILPLALFVPPLLDWRRQRRLGGPIYLSRPQAKAGVCAWMVALPLLGWASWPTVQSWGEARPAFNQLPLEALQKARGWPVRPANAAEMDDDNNAD